MPGLLGHEGDERRDPSPRAGDRKRSWGPSAAEGLRVHCACDSAALTQIGDLRKILVDLFSPIKGYSPRSSDFGLLNNSFILQQ